MQQSKERHGAILSSADASADFRATHSVAPTAYEETRCTGEPVARPLLQKTAHQHLHDLLGLTSVLSVVKRI